MLVVVKAAKRSFARSGPSVPACYGSIVLHNRYMLHSMAHAYAKHGRTSVFVSDHIDGLDIYLTIRGHRQTPNGVPLLEVSFVCIST